MSQIGIIGAGIAGLHLGIALRRHDVDVTIYADRSADELRQGPLLNTVMHHHLTLDRERRLGIGHWNPHDDGWRHRYQYAGGAEDSPPIRYSSTMAGSSLAVDYRLYLPRLMKDFEDLGGRLVVRTIRPEDADRLAGQEHDLLVVATGRHGMGLLFPTCESERPVGMQRQICAVLVDGIQRRDPDGVTFSIAPEVGELIEIPILTNEGRATALLFESLPNSAAAARLDQSAHEDPGSLRDGLLQILRMHYPDTGSRVDDRSFSLHGPRDVFTGAVSPVKRQGSAYLPCGKLAVALGDAHVMVDPLMGQGANMAAFSADKLAGLITDDLAFDEQFRRRLDEDREPVLHAAYEWTNLQLRNPPHLRTLHAAAAANPALASDLVSRYAFPTKMWQVVATPDRTRTYLDRFAEMSVEKPAPIEES